MDGSFVITWEVLLVAGIIVLAVYVAELLLLMGSGKSFSWRKQGVAKQELIALQSQVEALTERIQRLEEKIISADNTEEGAAASYGKAFTLAKQGVDVAQVASRCGISRAEAELIVSMQRNQLH